MKISSALTKKLKGIKLIISDVDGVLTEGKLYLTEEKEIPGRGKRDALHRG